MSTSWREQIERDPYGLPIDGRCTAKSKTTGERCGQRALLGQSVCRVHGGASPQGKAKGKRIVESIRAAEQVAKLGLRVEVDPATALLDLVHWTAGEVAYWRVRVEALKESDLTWGVTRVKDGGDDRGTTSEAKANIAYVMLERSSDRLATYCAAALKAGVEKRRIELAERQGDLVAGVIRAVLDALNLTPEQQALVPQVVPAQLRLLTAAGENA